jgi:hypothetical protein
VEVLFIMAIVSGIVALIVKAVSGDAATQLGMRFTPGSMMHTKSIKGVLSNYFVDSLAAVAILRSRPHCETLDSYRSRFNLGYSS